MSQGKTYFREIDSLRALSVLSVIVFHLDRTLLPGGYTSALTRTPCPPWGHCDRRPVDRQ